MSHKKAASHPAVQLFLRLLEHPAPPLREEAMAACLRKELDGLGYGHETDGAGNLLVPITASEPDGPLTILAAHMDELGMTVSGIEPDGRLRVIPSGSLKPYKIGERPLVILGSQRHLTGIFSLGSSHQKGSNESPGWPEARVITGLTPDALREAGVQVGTSLTLSRETRGPVFLGDEDDPLIAAWTFDDRMGCVTLLRLLEIIKQEHIRPRNPLIIAFTVHEEGCCHGVKSLCLRKLPETLIAIDGCPVTDAMPLTLDGRPAVWTRDSIGIYDHTLVDCFCRLAAGEGIDLQRALYESASSDASAAYQAGGAERIGLLGHVRANSHGFEVARLSVFDRVLTVLKRYVAEYA